MSLFFWWAVSRLDDKDKNIVFLIFFYVLLLPLSFYTLFRVGFKEEYSPALIVIFTVIIIAIIIPIYYVIKWAQEG